MKQKTLSILVTIPLFLFSGITMAQETNQNQIVPKGWMKVGSKPEHYIVGTDNKNVYTNKKSMFIQGMYECNEKDFGTVMQNIGAKNYLNKRLKLSVHLKSNDWQGWAGIWLRTNDKKNKVLTFENTQNRPIKGTTDWQLQEIVLDIPQTTDYIAFGIITSGKGMLWADNIKLDIVSNDTPLTAKNLN